MWDKLRKEAAFERQSRYYVNGVAIRNPWLLRHRWSPAPVIWRTDKIFRWTSFNLFGKRVFRLRSDLPGSTSVQGELPL